MVTHPVFQKLLTNIEGVIQGKTEALSMVLCCTVAGGHVLLNDIPGTGKTTLAKALAVSMGCDFKRVQFTPDLLPTDILGTSIFNPKEASFSFRPGPVFTNILIADEINRASPRTQSVLLESLSEQQVTIDGETRALPAPFLCIATLNPIEFHGTYPLPEAALDRFSIQLSLGYPPLDQERSILSAQRGRHPLEKLEPVIDQSELLELQTHVSQIHMEDTVSDYLLRIVHATREHPNIQLGVSMRGALQLARLARVWALMSGRDYVLPEDIKRLARVALAHRLVIDAQARYASVDRIGIIDDIVKSTSLPR